MRDITLCHPRLQKIAAAWIKACAVEGITVAISETLRTAAEQDALYAQGRTKPGNIVTNAKGSSYKSQHQWGIAFDIAINDSKLLYNEATIRKVAKIAKSNKVGLAWGGDWVSPVDTPHFYLGKWGDTPAKLKRTYGTFEKFKKTWTKEIFGTKKGLNIWNKTRTKVLKKKIPNKTKVNVMYVKKGYAKVEYNGVVGYMKAKYLL